MQSSLPGVITIASFPFGPGFPGIPFSPSKPGSPGIPGGPTGPLGHLFSVRMLHWHLRLFIGFSRYGSEESLFVVAIFCTNSVRPLSTNSLCPGGNGTDLNIQFIPDDVDFVEKNWRRDKTEKHTENAETSGQNGHRLHGKCSIQFFTTIHAVFMRTSVKLLLLLLLPNSKQQPTGMNHCNSGGSFFNVKCKSQLKVENVTDFFSAFIRTSRFEIFHSLVVVRNCIRPLICSMLN
ncbi:hypothetical protein T03_3067 [Trichinella britovi]|uniref:Accumulation-associated protein n=1 Tax=Trichinella britovi TaxID=45882 RepID=A0A0V1CP34_TRIBR|nr:hypothetical protein T03_3067 [Trichinella britovi]